MCCVPLCTPVYPCVPLCTPVYPCVPLCTPVYPCVSLCTVPQCTPMDPCVPLCTPVYPCVPLCTLWVPMCTPVYCQTVLYPRAFLVPLLTNSPQKSPPPYLSSGVLPRATPTPDVYPPPNIPREKEGFPRHRSYWVSGCLRASPGGRARSGDVRAGRCVGAMA
jgi:hypothetical protein